MERTVDRHSHDRPAGQEVQGDAKKRVALRIGGTARPSGGGGHIRPGVRIPKNGRQVPKTEKAESPLRNQIGISRADAEQQPHSPGIAEEFDVRKAVLYSEIMAPKFKEE